MVQIANIRRIRRQDSVEEKFGKQNDYIDSVGLEAAALHSLADRLSLIRLSLAFSQKNLEIRYRFQRRQAGERGGVASEKHDRGSGGTCWFQGPHLPDRRDVVHLPRLSRNAGAAADVDQDRHPD